MRSLVLPTARSVRHNRYVAALPRCRMICGVSRCKGWGVRPEMRCNPWRWLWGLPLLAILVWITGLLEQDTIEADLRTRSEEALRASGYAWAVPQYGYRDGRLSGTAPSEDQAAEALSVVRNVWGVRIADGSFDTLRSVADYIWSARKTGDAVVVSGYAPDAAARDDILQAVKRRFSTGTVTDRMELAAGAPPAATWLKGIEFGLDQLALLSQGEFLLRNTGVSLVGEARSVDAFQGIKGALRSRMPSGFALVRDGVTPPIARPYVWSAAKEKAQVVLSGSVPSFEVRKALFEVAKSQFPGLAVVDRMEIAAGDPDGFARAAEVSLFQLARLATGAAEIKDTRVVLAGEAADQIAGRSIENEFESGVPANFDADAQLTFAQVIPPRVSPFKTGVDVTLEQVRLSGNVPSQTARETLIDDIKRRFPGRTILDETELASGQPEGWRSCLLAGLFGLEKLGGGVVEMEDRNLTLSGKTADEALASGLPGQVRAQANRACESEVKVIVDTPPEPDLVWRARHQDDTLVFEGKVPDAATRTQLVQAGGRLFPKAAITDRMTVAGGYAERWRSVAATGLAALAKLRIGEAVITGTELLVRGEAKDTAIAEAVKDQLAHNLAKGYLGRDIITVRSDAMIWAESEAERKAQEDARRQAELEAQQRAEEEARRKAEDEAARLAEAEEQRRRAEEEARRRAEEELRRQEDAVRETRVEERRKEADRCEQLLKSAAAEGSIQFRFASAALDRKSFGTLDKLVQIAKTCPQFNIDIEGHTDAEGRPDRNLVLSQQRAQSVVDYLVDAGIPVERLRAVGYGETRPVAPNDTSENRARNRRIEFSVRID